MEMNTRAAIAAVGVGVGLIGMSAVAHWTAGQLGHHAILGGADVLGMKLYAPWAPATWVSLFNGPFWLWPEPFYRGLFMSASTALVSGLFAAKALLKGFTIGKGKAKEFGKEHWGTMQDAIKAGLVMGKGKAEADSDEIMVVGKMDGQLLTVTDGMHISGFGPSGSGKTRTLMVPSLLAWNSSAVVYAAGKGDLIHHTSGYRETFSNVRILDLGDVRKSRFNPLSEIRLDGINEVDDAQIIASQLVPAAVGKNDFWDTQGTRLIGALILHVLGMAPPEHRNMGAVWECLQADSEALVKCLCESLVPMARDAGQLLNKEQKMRDSVIASALAFMKPWDSPKVRKITSSSDFNISDLVCGNKPFTLYLRVPSDMREVWRPVLKVLIGQITRAMMHDQEIMPDGRRKRHKLGMFLDEFHSFYIPGFGSDLAEMRSYGMQCLLCSQSPKSLKELYGQHETITENCRVKVFMASGDPDTARVISEKIGTATEIRSSHSSSRQMGQPLGGSTSTNQSEQTRLVMSAGDVRAFDNSKMLLDITSEPVFQVNNLNDFNKHPVFAKRIREPVTGEIARPFEDDVAPRMPVDEIAMALE